MPVYQCYSPKGLLTASAKAKIADEMPEGDCFTAGKPASQSLILGINRYGRDLETRRSMLRELSQIWTRNSGQPEADLWISVTEIDPTNVLEAGLFIPAPGHEREWFEENREKLAELGIAAA